ncbi:oligosaccharide flippase family protein [Sulfitobacter sediminilitoris]
MPSCPYSVSIHDSDPLYLDTAWTLQVGRGLMLWGLTIALALPVADFFNELLLAIISPNAGVELAINGLMPTRVATAMRHLLVARVTLFRLLGQLVGVVIGQAGAHLLTLPAIIWLSHAHGAWDRAHDMTFFILSMAAWVLLFWLHNDRMYTLLQTGISG